jgi:hypothetical protein
MSGDESWPPSAESLLPLLGLSEAAVVVAEVAAARRSDCTRSLAAFPRL